MTNTHQKINQPVSDICKLAFFVTSTHCYAAIEINGSILCDSHQLGTESQSAALIPFIKGLWDSAKNLPPTLLIAPKGPGSFTSLRVTLAVAQGLSLSFPNAHCFAPTYFDALLYGLPEHSYAVIDSKRGDYFVKTKTGEAHVLSPEAFNAFQNTHKGWQMILDPDLTESNLGLMTESQIITFEPEHILTALLDAPSYTPAEPASNPFAPYYLFDPTFKKSQKPIF